ncbi:DUF4783 domain-containing protein [uncultured Arcticibacterium sp.]|uniref:DUF4783 domain-containing protein n=1 Tax=uncultured Arcticibacterium sp. TaxID=2173042 RepID=UPI0030F5B1D2
MKYIYGLLLCLFLTNSVAFINHNDKEQASLNEIAGLIESSFSRGNADLLGDLLADELELVIDSEKIEFAKISKERASYILSSFFKTNPPVEFSYVYQGTTSKTLRYSVANYKSKNKEFKIYMLIKEDAGHHYGIKTLQMRED